MATEEEKVNTELYKLVLPEQKIADIGSAVERRGTVMEENAFYDQFKVPGTVLELFKRMLDTHNAQTDLITAALEKISDPSKVGDEFAYLGNEAVEGDAAFTLKNRVLQLDKSLKGAEVSGEQARMLILASNHNIKRTYLYNSGFNIVLRGPSLTEMNLLYNRLQEDMDTYGRMFGSLFYMYSDIKIKAVIWDFIHQLVIGSNLNKWDKGNRLRDNISFNDYMPIMLAVATLMYKEGYDFVHPCPSCEYVSQSKIDLNLLQLTDFNRLPLEILKELSVGKEVTPADVSSYKKGLKQHTPFKIGRYLINRRIPSIGDYLDQGTAFNEQLYAAVYEIKESNIIDQYLKFNYSRIFEPWIASIEIIDEASQETSFKLIERDAIGIALTELQNSDDRDVFIKEMNDYITGSSLTNIGYLATPCECCGTVPTNITNGFVPFDVQSSFFTMLVMRLIQVD